jgi:hypothetical protein
MLTPSLTSHFLHVRCLSEIQNDNYINDVDDYGDDNDDDYNDNEATDGILSISMLIFIQYTQYRCSLYPVHFCRCKSHFLSFLLNIWMWVHEEEYKKPADSEVLFLDETNNETRVLVLGQQFLLPASNGEFYRK